MMAGTVTYPIAVRIARKRFKLKGFWAIHLAIAPFLALVHVNILGVSHMYFRIKQTEREYDHFSQFIKPSPEYQSYRQIHSKIINASQKDAAFTLNRAHAPLPTLLE